MSGRKRWHDGAEHQPSETHVRNITGRWTGLTGFTDVLTSYCIIPCVRLTCATCFSCVWMCSPGALWMSKDVYRALVSFAYMATYFPLSLCGAHTHQHTHSNTSCDWPTGMFALIMQQRRMGSGSHVICRKSHRLCSDVSEHYEATGGQVIYSVKHM